MLTMKTHTGLPMILKSQKEKCRIIFSHPEAFISCNEGRMLLFSKVSEERVMAWIIDEAHLVEEWSLTSGLTLLICPNFLRSSPLFQ